MDEKRSRFRAGEMDPHRDLRTLSFCNAGASRWLLLTQALSKGMGVLCAGSNR